MIAGPGYRHDPAEGLEVVRTEHEPDLWAVPSNASLSETGRSSGRGAARASPHDGTSQRRGHPGAFGAEGMRCEKVVGVNRLAGVTSPYLLQHADNPVDWWPWGPDAFEEARRRDVPVLLSVGYAACHWCHVMAHESFEDEALAAYANEHFVAVKVDREERPDVDAVYMEAVQAATGQGGWPMTVFLTPERDPFYFGTYFPPEPRHGMPGFRQVLEGVTAAWRERRDEVGEVATRIRADLAERASVYGAGAGVHPPGEADLGQALVSLGRSFDGVRGGFGGAPKFPPSMVLEFLLRHHARTGSEPALEMVRWTCEAMARGGIYDQLGGGFARYSVDADWIVPHFEKMLYDNALLLRVYLHLWRATGEERARRVALETADFLLRELRTEEGGFASALDADSLDEGTGKSVEGAYYAWTPKQLTQVLGEADGGLAAELFSVTAGGTFDHGSSVLQMIRDPEDSDAYDRIRARLMAARAERPPRRGTTRWSPPGTAWRSPLSPRPVRCWTGPIWWRPPRGPATCCSRSISPPRAACCAPRGTDARAPTRACWRTTPTPPRGSSRSMR